MKTLASRLALTYFVIIALAFIANWIGYFTLPGFRRATLADAHPDSVLYAFFLPDVVFFVIAPLAAALGIARSCAWTAPVAWTHFAAVLYGALWMWSVPILESGQGLLGAIVVTPLVPLAFAAALTTQRSR